MTTNTLTFNGTEFTVGMRVSASDGTKRPPDRFNRKLESWKDRNFTGTITELHDDYPSAPDGLVTTTRDDYPDRSIVTFRFTNHLGGLVKYEPLKEAA